MSLHKPTIEQFVYQKGERLTKKTDDPTKDDEKTQSLNTLSKMRQKWGNQQSKRHTVRQEVKKLKSETRSCQLGCRNKVKIS